jgi:hypothetical protein
MERQMKDWSVLLLSEMYSFSNLEILNVELPEYDAFLERSCSL